VRDITGGAWCTVEDSARFYSYRRDGVTGRMVAAVWIDRQRHT
jgi:copper oxidase (laccase) domain-containing protein